jgi:general stress protein 26
MNVSRSYWVTTHARGYPSSRPVWGIWRSPRLWFSTGSAIGRHLRSNPRVQVNLESADEVVIIEGIAGQLAAADARDWATTYAEKYHWEMPESNDDVWQVTPERVLAWLCDSSGLDGGAGFANSATEWRFPKP